MQMCSGIPHCDSYLHHPRRVANSVVSILAGPLPRFEGVVLDTTAGVSESGTASPPPAAGGPIRVPPLQPDDVNKFVSLFEKSEVVNGLISGKDYLQVASGCC